MAGESCNLNKDEAEILKPSSSSSASPPPPPPSSSAQQPAPPVALPSSSLYLKPSLREFQPPERPELVQTLPAPALAHTAAASTCPAKLGGKLKQPATSRQHTIYHCSSCHKKVGLTGFRCRCGELFCPRHRYSDTHDCSFDYKAAGREQISKENPLIRAAKIIKI